jgi:WD40 repeat protein
VKDVDFAIKSVSMIQGQSGADKSVALMAWLNDAETLLAVATTAAVVEVLNFDSENLKWSLVQEIEVTDSVLALFTTLEELFILSESEIIIVGLADMKFSISKVSLESGPYHVGNFMKSETLQDGCSHPNRPSYIVAAFESRPPVIISLENGKIEWSGKNANDTPLGLNSKFHTTALVSISDKIFAAGDQSGKLRLYDIKTQRKPVLEMPIYETFQLTNNYTGTSGMGITRPITTLSLSRDSSFLFIGDTFGTLISVDIRKAVGSKSLVVPSAKIGFKAHTDYCRKLLVLSRNFKGMMGSVRSVAVTDSILYAVTAGRYAYAYDLKNPKKMEKIFLSQKLTACLAHEKATSMASLPPGNDEREDDSSSIDDDATNDLLNHIEKDDDDHHYVSKKFRR